VDTETAAERFWAAVGYSLDSPVERYVKNYA
jgi:hypothetical protein